MTAGRSLRTSPPTAGSKFTHQTSPRFIGDVSDVGFGPLQRFGLARFFAGHLLIGNLQVFADDVRTNQRFDKLTDPPPPDDGVEPFVDALIDGDGKFLLHGGLPGDTCNYTCYSSR